MAPPNDDPPQNPAGVELSGRAERATYQRVTVYLTREQYRWLKRVAGEAAQDRVPISASDVVRLAVDGLRQRPGNLRRRIIEHARAEVSAYPGRAKRGLPVSEAAEPRGTA